MLFINSIVLLLSIATSSLLKKGVSFSKLSIIMLYYVAYIIYTSIELLGINKKIITFNNLLVINLYTQIFNLFIYIIVIIILLLTSFYPYNNKLQTTVFYKKIENVFTYLNIKEYSLIILFVTIGGILLTMSNDIITIFLCIELQSYAIYIICGLNRNSESSLNASLMYFLIGALASSIILLGQSLLYLNTGNTNLENINIINNIIDVNNINNANILIYISIQNSLLIMVIGFLFKISSAPFHFWSPSVYDYVPTVVTTFIAIVPKITILTFLLILTSYISKNVLELDWTFTLIISSILSLIIGSIMGLVQFRIKRLYAYSTISHLGFILLALLICDMESLVSFIFYLMQYSLSNLNAFFILILIGLDKIKYDLDSNSSILNKENILIEKENSPLQYISQLKGYFHENPLLSISLCLSLLSFIGIPPMIGFFAKQMVLGSALKNGYIFISFIGIFTSVVSATYYLNIIKVISFDKSDLINTKSNVNNIYLSNSYTFVVSSITLVMLSYMLYMKNINILFNIMTLSFFNA
jgi:NADH-ubiquinone oxidoreductase chain 2